MLACIKADVLGGKREGRESEGKRDIHKGEEYVDLAQEADDDSK